MKHTPPTRRFALATLAAAFLSVSMVHISHAAKAEPMDLDDDMRALVAKEKTKQRRVEQTAGGKNGSSGKSNGCGQIDIGNEEEKKGSKQTASREKTVIVTGPVVNATNCR